MKLLAILALWLTTVSTQFFAEAATTPNNCQRYMELLRPPSQQIIPSDVLEKRRLDFASLSDPIRADAQVQRRDFDPEGVLRVHGWNPDDITIEINRNHPDSSAVFELTLLEKGDPIAYTIVGKTPYDTDTGNFLRVRGTMILDKKNHGRGMGSLMYLLAAHVTSTEFGASLTSSPTRFLPNHPTWIIPGHSSLSERLWVNFVLNGYAKERRNHEDFLDTHIYYVIDGEEWKSNPANERVADFYTSHLVRDSLP